MFSKQDQTYKSQTGGYRKYIWATIGATAAMLGGAALFGDVQTHETFNMEAGVHFVNFLADHRDYMVDTHNTVVDLIEEGQERQKETMQAILNLNKSGKVDMKGQVVPGLKGGKDSLTKNVKFGDKTTKSTVKPESVTKNFGDSAQFAAEISSMFKEEYGVVTKLRQDLKVHHFDLANAIKDVELLATTTKDNLRRSIKKLALRKRYLEGDRLKPSTDAKIWKYEVKYQSADLQTSLEKCDAIVAILVKLQKDCARTSDNLDNVLNIIKKKLKERIDKGKQVIADLEKQAAAAKCNFWQMIFTFGAACRAASKLRNELNAKIGNHRAEVAAAAKLDKRFHYFDGLKKLARTLTQEASGLLDVTKEFRSKLASTQKQLTQDFTDDEIDDQLGDEDFMNDFAEQLFDALDQLSQTCDHVIKDCKERKTRLTNALIWDKIGEEDLMQLAATGEAELMSHFYEDLGAGCNKWYSDASQKFNSDVSDMKQIFSEIGAHKFVIMNYANEEFHTVKGSLFNIVDSLIDVQRAIESVDSYFNGRLKYMTKRINHDSWKYQLKYSTGITKRCESEHAGVAAFEKTVVSNSVSIAKKMGTVAEKFIAGGKKDLQAWNCERMYPQPQPVDIGAPKWLGGVSKWALKGFEVYNMVKKFIPGGSKAGAGPVPGGPQTAHAELMDIDWDQAKETGIGLGKKLLDDMQKEEKEQSDNMASRMRIWRAALAMCEEDKQSYVAELKATQKTIEHMAKPTVFSTSLPKFTIAKELNQYTSNIAGAEFGDVTDSEKATNKANLTQFTQDVKDGFAEAAKNMKAAEALKQTLLGRRQ